MEIKLLFGTILSLSVTGSVMIGMVILIKRLFKNKFSVNWHYYIWFLILLRLIIPYTPHISLDIKSIFSMEQKKVHSTDEMVAPEKYESVSKNSVKVQSDSSDNKVQIGSKGMAAPVVQKSWSDVAINHSQPHKSQKGLKLDYTVLSNIWFAGTTIMLTYIILVNFLLFMKCARRESCKDEEILRIFETCRQEFGMKRKVRLVYDSSVRTPLIFGLLRPTLLISSEVISKITVEEIRFVFLHELVHLKRRDILVNWVTVVLQSIHWFNPFVWIAFRSMKQDCELSCDFWVLRHIRPYEYNVYGQTILSLVRLLKSKPLLPGSVGMVEKSETGRRIKMISRFYDGSFKKARDIAGLITAFVIALTMAISLGPVQETIVKAAGVQSEKTASQQKAILKGLDSILKKEGNIKEAIKYIVSNIKKLSPSNASAALNKLEDAQNNHLDDLVKKCVDDYKYLQGLFASEYKKLGSLNKLYNTTNKDLKKLVTDIKDSGFKIETAEGMYYPVLDYSLYKKFAEYVMKDTKDYYNIMAVESNGPPAKDAALIIGWKDLIDRGLVQEKFINSYKSSPRYNKVLELFKKYVGFIMYGANNTPLFDYETKTINSSAKNAYYKAVQNKGSSKLLGFISSYLKVLKGSNYKQTANIEVFRNDVMKNLPFIYQVDASKEQSTYSYSRINEILISQKAKGILWSPNKRMVQYVKEDSNGSNRAYIWVVGQKNPFELETTLEGEHSYCWSPNSRYFISSSYDGNYLNYLHDTSSIRIIDSLIGSTTVPVWSPDGNFLAYSAVVLNKQKVVGTSIVVMRMYDKKKKCLIKADLQKLKYQDIVWDGNNTLKFTEAYYSSNHILTDKKTTKKINVNF